MSDEIVSFISLPYELYEHILRGLEVHDLKRVRLVCKKLCAASNPGLFESICLSFYPRSWEKVQSIASHPTIRSCVRKLAVFPKLLPHFPSQKAWAQCVDMRPFEGKYWSDRSNETGERIFEDGDFERPFPWFLEAYSKLQKLPWDLDAEYAKYKKAVGAQRKLTSRPSFYDDVTTLFSSFPRLSAIQVVPWYEDWWETPPAHSTTAISPYDLYRHWFKRKEDQLFNDGEPIYELWSETQMFRSSILESRTAGTIVALRAASKQQELGLESLRRLDLHLDLVGTSIPQFAYGIVDTFDLGDSSDSALYAVAESHWKQALFQSTLASITTLTLTIQNGIDLELMGSALEGTCRLLNSGLSLVELNLNITTLHTKESDHAAYLKDMRIPNLRSLSISGMSTAQKALYDVIRGHASSLTALTLERIYLTPDSWSEFFKELPQVLTLRELSMYDLTDDEEVNEHYWDSAHYFQSDNCGARQAITQYVTAGGTWPGLVGEELIESDLAGQDPDLGWD